MMARIDVQRLNVPADFAAIFDKPAAAVVIEPVKPQAAPVSQAQAAPVVENCSKCQSRLSAVEAKMGRCLSCGTAFSASQVKVGI